MNDPGWSASVSPVLHQSYVVTCKKKAKGKGRGEGWVARSILKITPLLISWGLKTHAEYVV